MSSLKQRFDIIIFDMPAISDPILPVNLTRQMDGMLFVVDSRTTTKTDISRISQRLGKDRILGFVLNRAAVPS
jgi:Mrp family chromosome partitioning ATPase